MSVSLSQAPINQFPIPESKPVPSTSQKVVKEVINLGIGMPLNYYVGYFIGCGLNKMNLKTPLSPENMGMLSALSLPVKPITTYCITKALGCKPDTPWRNMTALAASSLATTAISALACNALGYEIDTPSLVYRTVIGLGLSTLMITSFKLAQKLDESNTTESEVSETPDETEEMDTNPTPLDSDRITPVDEKMASKVESIQRDLFSPAPTNDLVKEKQLAA